MKRIRVKNHIIVILLVVMPAMGIAMDTVRTSASRKEILIVSEREFLGAKVEVISSEGRILVADYLHKRKLKIDFAEVRAGNYLIRISKGPNKKEFKYSAN